MKKFMDKDFLLETETAKHLYHDYAAAMPLVDYHCHISPKEIYEDRRFDDLAQIWLGGQNPDGSYFGDHYKWRVMRSNGTPEEYVTGGKSGFERFEKFVEALEMAIGNPMYHWCNLELHKYFGVDGYLNSDNCREIWDKCNDMLQNDPKMTVRGLIEQSNVAFVGTTDDPLIRLNGMKRLRRMTASNARSARPSVRTRQSISISPVLQSIWQHLPSRLARTAWIRWMMYARRLLSVWNFL